MAHTLQKTVDDYLCANLTRWIELGHSLQRIPEIGFCEYQTGQLVEDFLCGLGLEPTRAAVTGRYATLKGRNHLATVALEGELDAIYCPEHPLANPETGLAHACGHHIQITALLAVAEALQNTGAMSELDGDVCLIAVPAEECLPTQLLAKLQSEGSIVTDSGKKELLRLGLFEPVDIVLGSHALVNDAEHPDDVMINSSCNGLVVLRFTFHGKTAHSTVCPEKGINALNAAVLTINGIQALRDSFDPKEYIRISYNLTEGGISIGNVPDVSCLEVIIAAKSKGAMDHLQSQVITAAQCGAQVLGCTVDLESEIGYLPYEVDGQLLQVIQDCGHTLLGHSPRPREHNYFSNDLGDVSQVIPTAQIVFGGFQGDLHSPMFHVTDEAKAYLLPARMLAAAVISLLEHAAVKALQVKQHFLQTHSHGNLI